MREILELSTVKANKVDVLDELKHDIQWGLMQKPKIISAKYLYDERGSDLFNQITRAAEYYLTSAEIEILQSYKSKIADLLVNEPFNLIDLGPGEGHKTALLINEFLNKALKFSYMPIDISVTYLKTLIKKFTPQFPTLPLIGLHADYFTGLDWVHHKPMKRNLVLFLGSSIGNFTPEETVSFLSHLHATLNQNDYVLLGFDLCKDIDLLMKAYDDSKGITREFNFNLLRRLNRELHTHFDVNTFHHYPTYNVSTRAMESYLISMHKQNVHCDDLNCDFNFEYMEPIHVESSYKYQVEQIQILATQTGFKVIDHFFDKQQYFLDSLWCKQ